MREFALLLKFAFLLLSVLLVFFSPRCFSYEFCACILFLYLIENLLYFTCYKEDVVSFHGVFFLSFLFANFIYPVFYYVDNTYVSLFRFEFDESVISYATSVAFCAYSCYLLGVLSVDRKMAFKLKSCNARFVTCSFIDALFYLILLLFFCYTFLGGFDYIEDTYENDNFGSTPFYIRIMVMSLRYLMLIFLMYMFQMYKNKHVLRKKYIYTIVAVCICFILAGNRGMPLGVLLLLLIGFNDCIRKINLSWLFAFGVIGVVLLSFFSYFRYDSSISFLDFSDIIESPFDLFLDLIINNRNLYSLISYAEHNGYTYFSTQLGIFSFIPFAQSFIVNVFDVGLHNLTSADFNSYLTFGSVAGELGLGTNMVSDIYLSFGLIGVVVIFYLFGIYLQYCKSNSINSIYCFIAYSVMVSDSVFIVRGSVFEIVKLLIWFSTFEKLRQIVCSYVKK